MANLLLAVPCGLGAGGVDAALNNCVAIHYASRHMNWLHCMWGIVRGGAMRHGRGVGRRRAGQPGIRSVALGVCRRGHTGRGVRRGGDGAAVESADVGGPA